MDKTPIKIIFTTPESTIDDIIVETQDRVSYLLYSDRVNNELLTVSGCKFFDDYHISRLSLMDNQYMDKFKSISRTVEDQFVFQGYDPNRDVENTYDFYTDLEGSRIITAVVRPGEEILKLCFNEAGDEYEEFNLSDNKDCYRLFVIADSSSQTTNITTKIHEFSDRPHLKVDKDLMTVNEANNIKYRNLYNSLTDVRNNCILGKDSTEL